MHDDVAAISATVLIQSLSLHQVQSAAEWLANHPHKNPDLEVALNLILQGRIVPAETGELVEIAYASPTNALNQDDIRGIMMAKPGNVNLSLESSDRQTAESLLTLAQSHGCPRRVATSSPVKDWLRPLLLQHYLLEREHNPLVMLCTQVPGGGNGRWAAPQDKPALQAYAEAYRAERGSGSLTQDWDDLIQRKQVAVLEHEEQIVSVVKRGSTLHHAIVVGTFTFPPFRKRGFARRLLAFFTQEMLEEYAAVKLWVDEDNVGAIALYHALGFQQIGSCYTGYFSERSLDVNIELARPEDAAAILEIHAAAVHQTAAPYYAEEVINSWARLPITLERIERVKQRWLEDPDRRVVVAKKSSQVVGFGFINKNNELQGLFVHPNFGRRGVGAKILAALEQEALLLRLSYLEVDASINAEAFYSRQGFEIMEHGTHQLASGQEMACVKMRKTFARG
jgi:ribosomal protein S18 acetylase RimI-like enzyme